MRLRCGDRVRASVRGVDAAEDHRGGL